MIINQTTTLIFEYPQDYLQEQEWCKTKEDRWIHKGTDTLGAVYENTISYSIGQPSNLEIPNNCETCKWGDWYRKGYDITTMDDECGGCCSWNNKWTPKDEPKPCEWCKFFDGENCYSQEPCKAKDEPQTDCAWK